MPSFPRTYTDVTEMEWYFYTDVTEMEWYFSDVPRLRTVIMSSKALAQLSEAGVSPAELSEVLAKGAYVRHRTDPTSVGLELAGVRLLFRVSSLPGAIAVCVNGYRVVK